MSLLLQQLLPRLLLHLHTIAHLRSCPPVPPLTLLKVHHTHRTLYPHLTPTDQNLHTQLLPFRLIRLLLLPDLYLERCRALFLEDSLLLAMVVRRRLCRLCRLSPLLARRRNLFHLLLLLLRRDSNQ